MRWLAVLSLCLGLVMARTARADEPSVEDRAAAEALFEEAKELMKAGRFADACELLDHSVRRVEGVGIIFKLAECYEKIGRSASAWRKYLHVVSLTTAQGDATRADVARQRAATLEPKLARLRVVALAPVDKMVVTLDGEPFARSRWGTAVPVDPGTHVVVARATGYADQRHQLDVSDTPGELRVEIAPLRAFATSSQPQPDLPDAPPKPPRDDFQSPFIVPGWITAGVGGATALAGTVLMIVGAVKESNALERCPDRGDGVPCPADVVAEGNDGIIMQDAGLVVLIAGLVTGGVGATLLVLGYTDEADDPSSAWSPWIGASPAGAAGGFTLRF